MTAQNEKFKLRKGQTDYTNVRWAPVINCILRFKGKILLVQRSKELNFYPGYWNGISGFLDDSRSLNDKITDEIKEELGIPKNKIKSICFGEIFDQDEPKYRKTWIVHPVLVEVATDKITLDFEAKSFGWFSPSRVAKLKLLPGFDGVLKRLSKFLK